MPVIPLGFGAYKRTAGRLPEIICRNMFVEQSPTNQAAGTVLIPFPGLVRAADGLDGPFRGMFQQAGTFSGQVVAVAGQKAYLINGGIDTELGAIPGTDRVVIDANATRAYIATGPKAFATDGVSVTELATPDSLGFSSVGYINGFFIFSQTGTSRFYWLEPGETVIDPLNFANAERGPDAIVKVVINGDEIWLFGEQTTEVWIPTGDLNAPFQRVGGRLYERGAFSRDSIAKLDNTIFWVGDDRIAYRADATPIRVSNHGIEERLSRATEIESWAFPLEGHTFWALAIVNEGSFLYDVATGEWPERQTYNRTEWRVRLGLDVNGTIYGGDAEEGILWQFDRSKATDDDGPLIRIVTGGTPLTGGRVRCNSFALECAAGWADISERPVVNLKTSDDAGNLWTDRGNVSIGRQGQYDKRVRWSRLGMIQPPGRIYRITMTDPVPWRISNAKVNEVF